MIRNHMAVSHKATPFCYETSGDRLMSERVAPPKKRLRYQDGIKPFPCLMESCNIRFFSNAHRKTHMRVHLGVKPHECDECPMRFTNKTELNKHKDRRHSDVRKFLCSKCGKAFKTQGGCRDHMQTHSDVRAYDCNVCGRSFARRDTHRVHMNIHTDNRPFKCRLCDGGFHSNAARRAHEKSIHNQA